MARRILIVDDDETAGAYLAAVLEHSSMTVSRVHSADEALALLTRSEFDMVLTDIYMPGRDGIELLQMVKQLWPAVPVIGMTDNLKLRPALECLFLMVGGIALFRKPVVVGELLALLASLPDGGSP
jgi:CheY-like chemotaxis protein